jgi:asparagine synthetase B (glutamine-hydrolysing)
MGRFAGAQSSPLDVHVVPAGHALIISADGRQKQWRYWPATKALTSSRENAVAEVRRRLETAVEEHLLADVPVASFLSGGIDSSVVTALAAQRLEKKLQTFSVGFDLAEFDESEIALDVAKRYGTDHHSIRLSEEEVIESVTEAVDKLDLPSSDGINTYIVSRAVARQGVKVALSGLGGDELFGGYPTFREVPKLKLLAGLPMIVRRGIGATVNLGDRLADLPPTRDAGTLARWRRRFMTDEMIRRAGLPMTGISFECPVELPDDFARISWAELTGYMRRMLLRDADQMSMAVSLEMRVPFLDHELVEYVLGLPAAVKRRGSRPKGLLIEACRDLLPASVYDRPKRGFVLADESVDARAARLLRGDRAERSSVARALAGAVRGELRSAFEQDRLHWTRLWSIVVLGQFARGCSYLVHSMRILRSTHSVNPAAGGPIESIKQSSAVLAKWGHTVEIVSLDAPNDSWVRECPVPVHALGPGRGSYGYAPGIHPLDRGTAHELRCGDRAGCLAIQQLRRVASVARDCDALLRVHARDARSVVQAHLPAEAHQEIALLAVGRIPRAARCRCGALHVRRRAASRAPIVLPVSLPRGGGELWDRGTGR